VSPASGAPPDRPARERSDRRRAVHVEEGGTIISYGTGAYAPRTAFVFEDASGGRWRGVNRLTVVATIVALVLAVVLAVGILTIAPGRTPRLMTLNTFADQVRDWPQRGIPGIANPIPNDGAPQAQAATNGRTAAALPGATRKQARQAPAGGGTPPAVSSQSSAAGVGGPLPSTPPATKASPASGLSTSLAPAASAAPTSATPTTPAVQPTPTSQPIPAAPPPSPPGPPAPATNPAVPGPTPLQAGNPTQTLAPSPAAAGP
jgi:hypothetical protein